MTSDLPLLFFVVGCVVVGQIILKMGMLKVGRIDLERVKRPVPLLKRMLRTAELAGGLALYTASALGWILVLSRTDLSLAYPFLGLAYAAVPLAGVMLLREPFSRSQRLGLALVVLGVVSVTLTNTR